jgi:hypothetical protein
VPDNLLVLDAGGRLAVLRAIDDGAGLLTLQVTTATPNSSLLFRMANGSFVRVATVLTAGVHTLAVATAA